MGVFPQILNSIFSNSIEIHSFELGVQITIIMAFVVRYSSMNVGVVYLTTILSGFFFFNPVRVVDQKPWYFFTGVIGMILFLEVYLVIKKQIIKFDSDKTRFSNPATSLLLFWK